MSLGVPVHVFGTETHMTAIVGMALGKTKIPDQEAFDSNDAANMFFKAAEVCVYVLSQNLPKKCHFHFMLQGIGDLKFEGDSCVISI